MSVKSSRQGELTESENEMNRYQYKLLKIMFLKILCVFLFFVTYNFVAVATRQILPARYGFLPLASCSLLAVYDYLELKMVVICYYFRIHKVACLILTLNNPFIICKNVNLLFITSEKAFKIKVLTHFPDH